MYAGGGHTTMLAPIYNQSTANCLQFQLNMRSMNAGRFQLFTQPIATPSTVSPSLIPLDNKTVLFDVSGYQGDIW